MVKNFLLKNVYFPVFSLVHPSVGDWDGEGGGDAGGGGGKEVEGRRRAGGGGRAEEGERSALH